MKARREVRDGGSGGRCRPGAGARAGERLSRRRPGRLRARASPPRRPRAGARLSPPAPLTGHPQTAAYDRLSQAEPFRFDR